MVRLREINLALTPCSVYSFNSNMVRLRDNLSKTVQLRINLFQFQYGSIKSRSFYHPAP